MCQHLWRQQVIASPLNETKLKTISNHCALEEARSHCITGTSAFFCSHSLKHLKKSFSFFDDQSLDTTWGSRCGNGRRTVDVFDWNNKNAGAREEGKTEDHTEDVWMNGGG